MVPIPEGSRTHSEESGYTDYGQMQEMLDQPGELTGSGGCLSMNKSMGEGGGDGA